MTRFMFDARYTKLRSFLERRGVVLSPSIDNALFPPDIQNKYEQYVDDMSVEYFFEKISEYYSLFTCVVFISFLRTAGYQAKYYHFNTLDDKKYDLLMYRYLYLLAFEAFTDFCLRFAVKRYLHVDISNKGRNKTITNYRTRFLFTCFLVYDLLTVYYSEITVDFASR